MCSLQYEYHATGGAGAARTFKPTNGATRKSLVTHEVGAQGTGRNTASDHNANSRTVTANSPVVSKMCTSHHAGGMRDIAD